MMNRERLGRELQEVEIPLGECHYNYMGAYLENENVFYNVEKIYDNIYKYH